MCLTICFFSTQWHVPFFCFFCKFGCRCHTEKKKQKNNNNKKETKNMFPNCGGSGLGVSTTLIRDVKSEILPEGHPDTPLHLNIQQCVMLTEKQLLKNVLFLVLCVSPTWLVKKQLAFYISVLFLQCFCFHLKFIFVSIFDSRTHSFFSMVYYGRFFFFR